MPAPPLTPLATAVLRVPRHPERVLAIAADEGDAALFLAREFPSARVRGVDSSARRIQTASERVGLDPEGRIAFKLGRPRALPFPDAFFDLVAQLDGRVAAAELARVLRSGGHLILVRTGAARAPLGLGGGPSPRRLARQGIDLIEKSAAGDGDFAIAQRRGGPAGDDE
ncbi:MAG: class I SAM-dependent methyltransferase [Solirubrobacterales bacterium]